MLAAQRIGKAEQNATCAVSEHAVGETRDCIRIVDQERLAAGNPHQRAGKGREAAETEDNVRRGFTEAEQFALVEAKLPDPVCDSARLAWLLGWRKGEAIWLTVDQVDRHGMVLNTTITDPSGSFAFPIPAE